MALLVANGVFFVLTFFVPGLQMMMFERFALWFPLHENFAVWQFVTSMFMHGSFIHIFFNLFALTLFGMPLEVMLGRRRFLIFYFVAGLGAAAIFLAVNWIQFQSIHRELVAAGVSESSIRVWLRAGSFAPDQVPAALQGHLHRLAGLYSAPMVGASGAVYGILAAFALMFPNVRLGLIFVPVPVPAKYFIPALVGLDLLSGVTGFSLFGGGVAHFAHVGGATIGFLLMWHWRNQAMRQAESRRSMGGGY